MDITEEQRKRAEANRLAAIAKRKALIESSNGQLQHHDPWKLFKCRKFSTEFDASTTIQSSKILTDNNTHWPEKFRVRLEICSPDSFSITPEVVEGCFYPGEDNCFRILSDCLSNVWIFAIFLSLYLFCDCLYFGIFVSAFLLNIFWTGEFVIPSFLVLLAGVFLLVYSITRLIGFFPFSLHTLRITFENLKFACLTLF